jgi:p-cumate 2,3-dioxygenase subunit beta
VTGANLRTVNRAELQHEVEDFLYREAELLDAWRLDEWLAMFTDDCLYLVPSTDRPDGDADTDLFLIRDDHFLLSQRVAAILDGTAWAESPRSTTLRTVTNVRAEVLEDGTIEARAAFVVHRSRASRVDVYPGRVTLGLVRDDHGGLRIRYRRAVLALEQLRPHGRVSIIL